MRLPRKPWLKAGCFALFVLNVLAFGSSDAIPRAEARPASRLVISGVFFQGHLPGRPEADEAIRLTNLDPSRPLDVSGWSLSDRFLIHSGRRRKGEARSKRSSRRGRKKRKGGKGRKRRAATDDTEAGINPTPTTAKGNSVAFPPGTKIPPGGSIWIAHKAADFKKIFGHSPAAEAENTDPGVPKLRLDGIWLRLPSEKGIVSLHNTADTTIDVVCYVRDPEKSELDLRLVPEGHWKGKPILLQGSSPFGWKGQILARDRDHRGRPLPDTNTAADWDSGFSAARLGVDPTHRIEAPGQSSFLLKRHRNVRADVLVTSAPDNNFQALTRAFQQAKKEILVNIYQFTSDTLTEPLVQAAKRGVRVAVLMDGSPVGGVVDASRYAARRLVRAGANVLWMRGARKAQIFRRYRFNHAKYVLIDQTLAIIGSENYGSTGHPSIPTYGNRGWEIHLRQPALVRDLLAVWREDTDEARYQDLVAYKDDPTFRWGAPKNKNFKPPKKTSPVVYSYERPPLRVSGSFDLQLVLSPDNSLHENESILGSIQGCKKEVLVLQNSIPLFWGKKKYRSFEKTPTLPLAAVIAAARKGCRVRVMIDSTWYHIRPEDGRDNDDTVVYLNELASKENLDLQAKLINLSATGLSKIHAKGVIVDREEVFVGSINWSENSFKGNREVGVILKHPKVALYYADLFQRDWLRSRIFRILLKKGDRQIYAEPSTSSKVLLRGALSDPFDVLAEVGEFYQLRLPGRRLGYLPKADHSVLMTPYEARFQIGRGGYVLGKITQVVERPKFVQILFQPVVERGLAVLIWNKDLDAFRLQIGGDPKVLFLGKTVQIQGRILAYRQSPQIMVSQGDQITVLE